MTRNRAIGQSSEYNSASAYTQQLKIKFSGKDWLQSGVKKCTQGRASINETIEKLNDAKCRKYSHGFSVSSDEDILYYWIKLAFACTTWQAFIPQQNVEKLHFEVVVSRGWIFLLAIFLCCLQSLCSSLYEFV